MRIWQLKLRCFAYEKERKYITYNLINSNFFFFDVTLYCLCLSCDIHVSGLRRWYVDVYKYITNCRQYCFGLLGLISAVLMSGMKAKLKKPLRVSHACGNISVMPECSNQRTIHIDKYGSRLSCLTSMIKSKLITGRTWPVMTIDLLLNRKATRVWLHVY